MKRKVKCTKCRYSFNSESNKKYICCSKCKIKFVNPDYLDTKTIIRNLLGLNKKYN